MLTLVITLVLAAATMAASALAHDETRWRYPMMIAVGCAIYLAAWGAGLMRKMLKLLAFELNPLVAAIAAAIPLGVLLWSLVARRRTIPRHTPGLQDDPVLRRHVDEKLRRARKRRQDEVAAEDTDVPVL